MLRACRRLIRLHLAEHYRKNDDHAGGPHPIYGQVVGLPAFDSRERAAAQEKTDIQHRRPSQVDEQAHVTSTAANSGVNNVVSTGAMFSQAFSRLKGRYRQQVPCARSLTALTAARAIHPAITAPRSTSR